MHARTHRLAYKMAKTFKSTEVAAHKKNSTITDVKHTSLHKNVCLHCTHTHTHTHLTYIHKLKFTFARSQPPTMQQDKWANHWERALPRVQRNQDYYPALVLRSRVHLCGCVCEYVSVCVCVRVPIHAWLGSMKIHESVWAVQRLPPPIMRASGPINPPI